ncbi:MAG: MCE family protein [Candidatus Eiseniibacteriota bacterium]|nr:MAG: MCE family protein [Candidatus Eisenbacteria bacterium]
MDRRGAEFKVGITVILALVILIGGIVWIKGFQVARQSFVVRVAFDEVGGLSEGDPVTVHGVTKGFVKAIELGRAQVYVDLSVDKGVRITSDTEFIIRNIGLMGEKYVAVKLGKVEEEVPQGTMLYGRFESGVPEVVGELGVALKEFEQTVTKVRGVLEEIEEGGDISGTLRDLRSFSQDVRGTVEENREGLRMAIENLQYSSSQLRRFVENRGPEIDSTVSRITTTSEGAQLIVERLEAVSYSVERVLQKLESGEGSLGKLLNDETLYAEMKTTLLEARMLIADIKQHPRRYLKFSLF